MENIGKLIDTLRKVPYETEWLEFKCGNTDPHMIGQDISALANGATLKEKSNAYMMWGIDDSTREIVGCDFDLNKQKKGNEELGNWLRRLLSKNAEFEFYTAVVDGKQVGLLLIKNAIGSPVMFGSDEYIRIGSYTKKLSAYPVIQRKLWERLSTTEYEHQIAKADLELDDALRYLDWSIYFDNKDEPQPSDNVVVMHYMIEEGIAVLQDNGLYSITNLGAILFSKRLTDFPNIARKAVRIIKYKGNNRIGMLKENIHNQGYANDFEGLIKYIEALIPSEEIIEGGLRRTKTAYPLLAIREAVANALIHQNLAISGVSPLIEVFGNRIEITNPGASLVDTMRIIDNPPKSRNEKLASLMRRLRICEELGTGWDKIVLSCEQMQLPAPKIELYEESTKVTLFSDIPFSSIPYEEKLWACYLHSCIKYVQGEHLTNSSLRERFGLRETASSTVSRLIKDAVQTKMIKPLDPATAPRYMKYIPVWA